MSQKTHQPFCNFKSLKRTGRFKPKVEHDSHAKEIPFNPLQITLESQPLMGKRRFSRFIQKTGKKKKTGCLKFVLADDLQHNKFSLKRIASP